MSFSISRAAPPAVGTLAHKAASGRETVGGSPVFWAAKRLFDILMAISLLPLLVFFATALLLLNPLFNTGPVFFAQVRMGRNCRAFRTLKFRTMLVSSDRHRGHDQPIEAHRITGFGRFLRKTRIDELPQILNVLRGEMSFIGPRPDAYSHARVYLRCIPEYRLRHRVRPGISGLAQVDHGYAVGTEATRVKARFDLTYIENAGFIMDSRLVLRTIVTILARAGA